MHLDAPVHGLDSEVGRGFAFADDHAVRPRPAIGRLGWFHGYADLGDPDTVASLQPANDLREQCARLIAQLLLRGRDAPKFVAVTRHFVLHTRVKWHSYDEV